MTCTRTRIQIRQLAGKKKEIFSLGIGIEVAESRSCFVLSTPSTAARLFQYSIQPLQSSPIKLKLLHFTLIALNCALLDISAMAFCILLWVHLLRPKKYITIKNHLSRFKNRTGFHDIGESEFWARTTLRKILSDFHIYIFRCSERWGKRAVLMLKILRCSCSDNQIQISRCSECWTKKIKDNCHYMCHIIFVSFYIIFFWKGGDHLFVIISWLEQSALLLFMRF